MPIVVNSSPLIFLVRLGFIKHFVRSFPSICIPQWVLEEIAVKQDLVHTELQQYIETQRVDVRQSTLRLLVNRLHQRLGKGESESIALAVELQAEYLLLDDSAARKEALRLGLNIKGTLGIIRALHRQGEIQLPELDDFYQQLLTIQFRVKRNIFDEIFRE